MLTTRNLSAREAKPFVPTYVSKAQVKTDHSLVRRTTPLSEIPTETLINLWVSRWGHDWVHLEDVDEDPFYSDVYYRLRVEGQLEVHFLTDRAKYVCRKAD